jgi:hypothetical protein
MGNQWKLSDKDQAEIANLASKFQFYENTVPQALDNLTIGIAGAEESGKTHLACSISLDPAYGPIFLLDSELRAHHVTRKYEGIVLGRVRSFDEAVAAVTVIRSKTPAPAVVILDSGTDLQKFAEEKYLERVGKERMGMPITYPAMWSFIYVMLDMLKESGYTVIFTMKMKDEYVNDMRTGKKFPRVFPDVPYRCDLVFWMNEKKDIQVKKNGFHDWPDNIMFPKGTTLSQLIAATRNNQIPDQKGLTPVDATPTQAPTVKRLVRGE